MMNIPQAPRPPDPAEPRQGAGGRRGGAAAAPEPDALRAVDLTVERGGRPVLNALRFSVPRGQVTGLLGPSGCGKTTLLRAVVGAQARVGGTLDVLGLPAGHPALRHRIGYVTQAPAVYTDLTARQNLDYFLAVLDPRAGRAERRSRVAAALAEVDLTGRADALVGRLSGGQRSRVSLAVALLGQPELLVLDEPTVGLDPVLRRDLWDLFHRLAAERGATLLVSSHVMDEAERCHRLLLLRDGALLADDTPAALRSRTGADTVEDAFLRLVEEADGVTETARATAPDTGSAADRRPDRSTAAPVGATGPGEAGEPPR